MSDEPAEATHDEPGPVTYFLGPRRRADRAPTPTAESPEALLSEYHEVAVSVADRAKEIEARRKRAAELAMLARTDPDAAARGFDVLDATPVVSDFGDVVLQLRRLRKRSARVLNETCAQSPRFSHGVKRTLDS
jgi:hypothetical protein